MSDQTQNQSPNPPPEPPSTPPVYHDWREQRRAELLARREARRQRHARHPYGWFGGILLLFLGIIFLLQNLGITILVNWWAILILIPAFWAFVAAWNSYQDSGKVTQGVVGSLAIGIILTILSVVLLLNLALGIFWPIILIIGGLILLVSTVLPR